MAALGFRAHSGWAALVAISGTPRSPEVLLRQRIVIWDSAIAGSKQPYHTAESWPLAKAQAFLDRCTRRSNAMAEEAIATAVREISAHEQVTVAGLLTASGRTAPTLQDALASHAALHTAEGELYRNAIAQGCEQCGLRVIRIREKEILDHGVGTLRRSAADLRNAVQVMGKALGSPWTQDEKLAALIAWIALAEASSAPRTAAKARRMSAVTS